MDIIDPLDPKSKAYEEEYHRLVSTGSPYEKAFGKMMLDFLDQLRKDVVGPKLYAQKITKELWLSCYFGNGYQTFVTATVDRKDYSPLVDGLPEMHYRLSYTIKHSEKGETRPRVELRTKDIQTACDFVVEAIRKCRL